MRGRCGQGKGHLPSCHKLMFHQTRRLPRRPGVLSSSKNHQSVTLPWAGFTSMFWMTLTPSLSDHPFSLHGKPSSEGAAPDLNRGQGTRPRPSLKPPCPKLLENPGRSP